MAGRKFYTVTVKPTMTASKQTAAYGNGDVLFDWTEVPVDRGTSKLVSVTTIIRGTNGVHQSGPISLLFSKSSSENTLGVENATATMYPSNNIIGAIGILDATFDSSKTDTFAAGSGVSTAGLYNPNLTLTPEAGGSIYISGIAGGALDFQSTVQVSTETATDTTAVVVKTTSALINFAAGDVLHDEADQVIGTISSVTDANNIVLTENCASVSAVNQDLYNINPITLIFGFEA